MHTVALSFPPDDSPTPPPELTSLAGLARQEIYTEEDELEELDAMLKGGSWVDWNDGRSTGPS